MSEILVIKKTTQYDERGENGAVLSETLSRMNINDLVTELDVKIYDLKVLVNNLVKGKAVELWVKGTDENHQSVKYIVMLERGLISIYVNGSWIPF